MAPLHSKDEILIYKKIRTDRYTFCLEEYWEEDDSGYCVSDFVLAKHTRLSVYDPAGKLYRRFDLDSREYDKDMQLSGGVLTVTWHPEYNEVQVTRIDAQTLQMI